jgi:hypothetical protein
MEAGAATMEAGAAGRQALLVQAAIAKAAATASSHHRAVAAGSSRPEALEAARILISQLSCSTMRSQQA